MSWLIVALFSYFLLAVANLVDKFLVEKVLGSARAYTFVVCVMGVLVFLAAPWFLSWPGWLIFSYNIFLGALFFLAILFLYASLRRGEASQVLVLIGGSTPIFSIPLSFWLLGDSFSQQQLLAVLFLIAGLLIIAFLPKEKKDFWQKIFSKLSLNQKKTSLSIFLAILSGFTYALFFVGSKMVYQNQEFLSAFMWIRLGSAFFALFILFSARARKEVRELFIKKPKRSQNQALVIGNQSLGALGFILQNYAIYLGPVAIINALQGVQYAWIIVLGTLTSLFAPKILKEDISKKVLLRKFLAVIIIGTGLYLLTL
jgi:drug/metabolite transporter (DMT)-like permease